MRMIKTRRQWFLVILVMSFSGLMSCFATPSRIPTFPSVPSLPSGDEVMRKSREHLDQIQDEKSKIILTLIAKDASQQETVIWRYWKNKNTREGFTSKSIFFTELPMALRGQAFLVWDYSVEGRPQDLWIYLPHLRNIRRVPPQDHGTAFMGSDLTFADMGQRRLNEDTHKTIGRDIYRGVACFVVDSIPKGKKGVYGKTVTWVSEDHYTVQRIDYYDQKGEFLKQQTIDWEILNDKGSDIYFWKKTNVVNMQNHHRTVLEISNRTINIGLSDDDFTERALKAGGL